MISFNTDILAYCDIVWWHRVWLDNNFIWMESSRLSQSRFSTHFKNTVVENLEDDKLYILKRLHYLFIFYASRASRYAYKEINEKCFMELMEDTFAEKQVRVHKNG